jgi:hypothetical protein
MGCNVQRSIATACLPDLPRIKALMKSLPKETRECSECGEEVTIHESEFQPVLVDGPLQFAKAAFTGCDTTIDKVIEGILREGARQELTLNDCFQAK